MSAVWVVSVGESGEFEIKSRWWVCVDVNVYVLF